jgi:type II secretion system protein G
MNMHRRGFTLIELLVVIAIIGLLSAVVLASLNTAREKAKVAASVGQLEQLRTVVAMYMADTGTPPPPCDLDCTAATDPYLNALGVPGWKGPYISGGVWNLKHPWGGHFTVNYADVDADGKAEVYFFLDEDAPGTDSNNNSGIIPAASLLEIDKRLDDGNFATGRLRANGLGYLTVPGELTYVPAL